MATISILELGRVREGNDRKAALDEARALAQRAEEWGYRRFWIAEHHNIRSVSTAATAVVIAHVAAGTKTIRVGAGGIMLPNHAPYVIAEQFGTLETLFPGRIDLGLGRAPGTDQVTLRALRRDVRASDTFPQDVLELQAYLEPATPGQRIEAVPGSGTKVPLWILGSSLFGAQLGAALGLPYGFASHFAPQALDQAIKIYRSEFRPSEQQQSSYLMTGLNVIAAETDEEAAWLATSQQMSFADLVRNQPSLLRPPIERIEDYEHWSPTVQYQASQMLACRVIGGPETVRKGLKAFLERTGADELMIVSDVYDSQKRFRSFEIIAEIAKDL
ncbi:LLM class flavin-dependent oxidoreductase [Planctomicrobium piriforme]|uniref:Luciferase-like monooxygenase n=1 Tax=Planctomicrobium piriforme TaxID=1576369 RepID=A0A1I3G3W3_9PLAN|nr:LLM class flavin-dependent oxidoreductase [Planctomicrobium piriforme]SFI18150.1 luciferase family oxidoreductase, group 1 [Planctomicrobium piriforme]